MVKGKIMQHYGMLLMVLSLLFFTGCVPSAVEKNTEYIFSFDSASIRPLTVSKGGELTVEWTYTIRNAPLTAVKPLEKIAVYKGKKLLAVLQEKPFRFEDGTWQDYLTFELPRGLSAGRYTIDITLTDGLTVYTKKIFFNIR